MNKASFSLKNGKSCIVCASLPATYICNIKEKHIKKENFPREMFSNFTKKKLKIEEETNSK